MALDPASLLGRAPVLPRVPRLQTLPLCREGSGAATRPAVICGPWPSSIKKNLAGLPMQLGSYVSKMPNIRAIMSLQDVWAGSAFNAYKMCGHVGTVQCRPC